MCLQGANWPAVCPALHACTACTVHHVAKGLADCPGCCACRVAQMKKGCILLNVSRGGLVENAALVSGLESRQIGGLGMDVYENEGQ